MTAQFLDRVLRCHRIGDLNGRFPIFDATGSTLAPGRWNGPTTPVIYASEHYATAMLEKLVHFNGMLPKNQHYIEIMVPNGLAYEVFDPAAHPGWDLPESSGARSFGEDWVRSKRSLILLVPSLVARIEWNIVINPAHRDFGKITTSLHQPVWWDGRLLGQG